MYNMRGNSNPEQGFSIGYEVFGLKTILLGDSRRELGLFFAELQERPEFTLAGCFEDSHAAMDYIRNNRDVDFALLDIDLPDAEHAAVLLQEQREDAMIICITAHYERAAEPTM